MKLQSVFSLLLVIVLLNSCQSEQSAFDIDEVVLIDVTDTTVLFPTANDIISPLKLKDNPYQNIRISISLITDKDFNKTSVIILEGENKWSNNIAIHKAHIQQFIQQIDHCLKTITTDGVCQHSIIYRTISRHANTLALSNAKKKYLAVYSNLYENSSISFYDPRTIEAIKNRPHTIEQQLEATNHTDTLKGVQLWFLYSPTSYNDNNTFMAIAALYQQLFEKHGASVHIGSTFPLQ